MADLIGTSYKDRTDNLCCSFLHVLRPRQER